MKAVLAGILLSTVGLPVLAADYSVRTQDGYELRRYYMDTGRAYGAPVSYYALIPPAPPSRFLYLDGARGPARVELDDRPPFPGPDWIPLIE